MNLEKPKFLCVFINIAFFSFTFFKGTDKKKKNVFSSYQGTVMYCIFILKLVLHKFQLFCVEFE